jgi:hypothetical protein
MRLQFQREQVAKTTGRVINVACKEDPAGLRNIFGDRIINADISEIDADYGVPIAIDVVMDCREIWPFDDDYAELVIMAEILEHLYVQEAIFSLKEARRVAPKLSITLPYDFTLPFGNEFSNVLSTPDGGRGHCTGWSEDNLRKVLDDVGFEVIEWRTIDYGIMGSARLDGFLVSCERSQ